MAIATETKVRLEIKGIRPLLMHSARACDPLSEEAKAMKRLTSIRKKSEEDIRAICKADWAAAFYSDEKGRPIVPGDVMLGALIAGAKKLKLGPQAKAGIIAVDDSIVLNHGHPAGESATALDFWNDGVGPYVDARAVKVQQARLIRYRPRFNFWTIKPVVWLSDEVDKDMLENIAETAGRLCGLGDFRPRFGGFVVERVTVL